MGLYKIKKIILENIMKLLASMKIYSVVNVSTIALYQEQIKKQKKISLPLVKINKEKKYKVKKILNKMIRQEEYIEKKILRRGQKILRKRSDKKK